MEETPKAELPTLTEIRKERGFKSGWNLSEGHMIVLINEFYDAQKLGTETAEFPQYLKRYFEVLRTLYYHIDPLMPQKQTEYSIGTEGFDNLFKIVNEQLQVYYKKKERQPQLLPPNEILENLHVIRRGLIREMSNCNLYFVKDFSKDKLKDLFTARKSIFEGTSYDGD